LQIFKMYFEIPMKEHAHEQNNIIYGILLLFFNSKDFGRPEWVLLNLTSFAVPRKEVKLEQVFQDNHSLSVNRKHVHLGYSSVISNNFLSTSVYAIKVTQKVFVGLGTESDPHKRTIKGSGRLKRLADLI